MPDRKPLFLPNETGDPLPYCDTSYTKWDGNVDNGANGILFTTEGNALVTGSDDGVSDCGKLRTSLQRGP